MVRLRDRVAGPFLFQGASMSAAAHSPTTELTGDFDLLVIGGGIVGAGVARDAALRNLRVALCEKGDFAAGTSSRSTRLLHGGIRYLAQGRIKLVREANREKSVVHRIAPHLSQAQPFVFPATRGGSYPRWQLSIGVKIYDLLCGRDKLGRSRTLGVEETLALAPGFARAGLTGSARYFDGFTNDARLVLDTLCSAVNHGAAVRNYVRFDHAESTSEGWKCSLTDESSQQELQVRARCIVNAAGPWSDRIPGSQTSLRLTKGVHLVIDHQRLPIIEAVVSVQGERILFAIPWGERVILGTTDTDYSGPLEEPRCTLQDRDYVLNAINDSFPEAHLVAADVLTVWAGLRPLVADRHGNPSDISRRHKISAAGPGWWDVTGGKLTTHRLMAEETVDRVVAHLGRVRVKCLTAQLPLREKDQPAAGSGLTPPGVSEEVVLQACRDEWAQRLDDVMLRRTGWGHYHREHRDIAARVAKWMQPQLGWTDEEAAAEQQRYLELTALPAAET